MALQAARRDRPPPFKTEFFVNGRRLLMEIDTGAGYSLISEDEWRLSGRPSLKSPRLKLVTYTGEPVDIKGEFDALVEWESQKKQLPLLVVAGSGPALVGRNWLRAIRMNWERILHLPNTDAASKLDPIRDVFGKESFPLASQVHSERGFPPSTLYHVEFFEVGVTFCDIQREMATDPVLSEVLKRLQHRWKRVDAASSELFPFLTKRNDLALCYSIILWGRRVVVPTKLRPEVLDIQHETHAGAVRMKALARSFVWWPGIDKQLEELAQNCVACRETCKEPARTTDGVWPTPLSPWHRLHIDSAGPVHGQSLLVIVDATTRWPEIFLTKSTTSQATIAMLQPVARFGLPVEIVSDNGPQFASEEFRKFTSGNGIIHRMGAHYHPQSNGLAERMVQSVKTPY